MQMSCKKGFLAGLFSAAFLAAQSETATLSGVVLDPSGDPVKDCRVSATFEPSSQRRAVVTDEDGRFVLPFLPPGPYKVRVECTGFPQRPERRLQLSVNDRRNLLFTPGVSGPETTVDVTDLRQEIQEAASVGTLVDNKFVENLPLNGRSFQNLITLTPGVVQTAASSKSPGQFSVNGQRTATNYFTVDGVSANFGVMSGPQLSAVSDGTLPALSAAGGTNSLVSVDAMQEFQVQTSTFAPEFGRSPGGQVSIVTRSGGNKYHGTLFNYFRNDKLDANDWFANRDGLQRAPVRQNDFGGVLGGPVWIPKVYTAKDRTFFFVSYEGLRLRQPQYATDAYPTVATRLRAAPASRDILNAYPIPNLGDLGGGFGRYAVSYSNPLNLDSTSVRLDHTFGSRVTLFGRYSESPSEAVSRGPISTYDLSLNTISLSDSKARTLTLGSTQTITPRMLNETRFNWARHLAGYRTEMDALGGATPIPESTLFPSFTNRNVASVGILPTGIRGFVAGTLADNRQVQWNAVDNFSLTTGAHQVKFGFDFRQLYPDLPSPTYQQFGVFAGLEGPVGMLGGRTAAAIVTAFEGMRVGLHNFSFYAQDTWRPRQRLSLTYGLRWDYNPPPTGTNGREIYGAIGAENPHTATLSGPGVPLFQTDKKAIAPRLGIAYQVSARQGWETTLRGGYGIFYDLPLGALQSATGNPPYRRTGRFAGVPFPLPAAQAAPAPVTTAGRFDQVYAFASDFRLPFTHQYNFAIEQALGGPRSVTLTYVGANGRRLLRREVFAQPRVYQTFDSVQITRSAASSDYHSLQIQFIQRLQKGLQLIASHAWSHSIDSNSDNINLVLPLSVAPQNLNRGSSDFDIRHVFTGALTWDIPYRTRGTALCPVLKNWGVDSVFRAQSAFPLDVFNRTATLLGSYDLRPNLVAGQPLYLTGPEYAGGKAINRAAFAVPAGQQTNGTLGRNVLRAFPLSQVDLTVRRQFNITETSNIQFRAEFFNVLNHPVFGSPDMNLANRLFGASTQMFGRGLGQGGISGGQNPLYTVGAPRSVQLALKLRW